MEIQVGDEVIYIDFSNNTDGKIHKVLAVVDFGIKTCCSDKGIKLFEPIGRFRKVTHCEKLK